MSYQDAIPSGPFAAWLNERVEFWTRRLDFGDRRMPLQGEVSPTAKVCREVGWPDNETGIRRLYRMRHQLGESAVGRKNDKPGSGRRVVTHTSMFNRRTVEEALHHAGVGLGELYPYEALIDEFAVEYNVPRDQARRLADGWIDSTWRAVWETAGLFVSEESRPQVYCRECKRTTRLFMGVCDSCGNPYAPPLVAAVMAATLAPAPDPLRSEVMARARWLREQYQMPYQQIAVVMAVYHGVSRTEETWRKLLRGTGVAAKPHGAPFELREAS